MRRRRFAGLVALAALAPGWAAAQGTAPMRRFVFLGSIPENDPDMRYRLGIFWPRMAELGWEPGRNLNVEYRWDMANRTPAEARSVAAEVVAMAPDVILSQGTSSMMALRQATGKVPIVFVLVGDPVGQGFVKSLKEPGGNVTGFSLYDFDFGVKLLQFFIEAVPQVKRVVVIGNPETTSMAQFLEPMQSASRGLGVTLTGAPVRDDTAIERAVAGAEGSAGDGLLFLPDGFTFARRERIVALVTERRVPAIYAFRLFAATGGLISFGIDTGEQFRQAAGYVDRILRGARPADLPVQAPAKFELVVNLKSAKALGIAIPQAIVARADEVIE